MYYNNNGNLWHLFAKKSFTLLHIYYTGLCSFYSHAHILKSKSWINNKLSFVKMFDVDRFGLLTKVFKISILMWVWVSTHIYCSFQFELIFLNKFGKCILKSVGWCCCYIEKYYYYSIHTWNVRMHAQPKYIPPLQLLQFNKIHCANSSDDTFIGLKSKWIDFWLHFYV